MRGIHRLPVNSPHKGPVTRKMCPFDDVIMKSGEILCTLYFIPPEAEWRKYASVLSIIGSDNGLSPGRHHAIIWTNAGILLMRTLGTNFSEILSKIDTFSFKKMHLKISSAKRRPFCTWGGQSTCHFCLFYSFFRLTTTMLQPRITGPF